MSSLTPQQGLFQGSRAGVPGMGSIHGGNYCDEARALFTRMTEQPTTALKQLIDKTIVDLKSAGIWNLLDCYWRFDLHTQQASCLNWKGNSAFDIVPTGSPTWTTKYGFTGASAKYLKTGFNPTLHGVNCTQNNNAMGIYMRTETLGTTQGFIGGIDAATVRTTLYKRSTDNTVFAYDNNAASYTSGLISTIGLIGVGRVNTNVQIYRNGGIAVQQLRTSSGNLNKEVYLLCYNNNGTPTSYAINQVASDAYIGSSSLSQSLLYSINTYFINNVAVTF